MGIIRTSHGSVTFLLITMDVSQLYTSIRDINGLNACRHFLMVHQVQYLKHTMMILSMMETCLTDNIFVFENRHYRQSQGTAVGTSFIPSHGNLFMGWWEEQVVWIEPMLIYTKRVILWLRYIDDLFIIWRGDEESLKSIPSGT